MADAQVEVVAQLDGADVLAGQLWSHRRRGRESAIFSYATSYLGLPGAYELDPALPLLGGQQQTAAGRALFGAFTDCAPDRWGQRLIARARRRARERGEGERSIGEIDFLLGVRDDLRQGALRFRQPGAAGFLAEDEGGVPLLTDLPSLLAASERIEREEDLDADLAALLHGGSSLGGARPKAHVIGPDGRVAIAKFPRPDSDAWDVIRWAGVALELAAAAGIRVPNWRLIDLGGRGVLIVDRFDRNHQDGRRIGYVSAMTMLEASDGEAGSYLEIADRIETQSPAATADLRQLWRRIAFSILISNTDDHLRNHGFLRLTAAGWSLSPAFDLNPNPAGGPLSTAIDFDSAEPRVETLLAVAADFRLGEKQALAVLAEVRAATADWRAVAARNGLRPAAIEEMAPAFERGDGEEVRAAS